MMESPANAFFDYEAYSRACNAVELRQKKLPPEDVRLLSREVIARLAGRFTEIESKAETPSSEEIDALCKILISDDPDAASRYFLKLRSTDIPTDMIYMGYIAGAARRLGEWWVSDRIHFVDVTIGANRLYVIMRAMRPIQYAVSPSTQRPVMFASTPGETHTLGITMAADLFRDRGWEIDLRTGVSHDEIVQAAITGRYAIIGLGASSQPMLAPLTRLIASLHVSSPISSILVSGPLARLEPQLKELADADCVALDAPTAIEEMDRIYAEIEARSLRA